MSSLIRCIDVFDNEYFTEKSNLGFRPSAYVVVFQGDTVLLSKQWDGYDFPGGGIDRGETIEETLIREAKEETGYDVHPLSIITAETSFYKSRSKEVYNHCLLLYYLAELTGGTPSLDGLTEEEKEYTSLPEWIPLSKITELKFYNSIDSVALIQKAHMLYTNLQK
jgi:8-oxo-dGTP diphosphatase